MKNTKLGVEEWFYLCTLRGKKYDKKSQNMTIQSIISFEIDPRKVDSLQNARSYIKHIPAEKIGNAVAQGKFVATTDFSRARGVDALIICVSTPLNRHRGRIFPTGEYHIFGHHRRGAKTEN